jgi:hypothetical protein
MSDEDAANDIAMDAFRGWVEPERLIVNVDAAYREFEGQGRMPDPMRLFALMAKSHFERHGCLACKSGAGIHAH